jgi:hypothetical protein
MLKDFEKDQKAPILSVVVISLKSAGFLSFRYFFLFHQFFP